MPRHLHDGQQRVETVEVLERDRHPDDGQHRRRGDHPGQVRRTTGAGDDHGDAPVGRAGGVVEHLARGAVRGDHADLERHVELGQRHRGGFHRRPVGVAAHDQPDAGAARACCRWGRTVDRRMSSVSLGRRVGSGGSGRSGQVRAGSGTSVAACGSQPSVQTPVDSHVAARSARSRTVAACRRVRRGCSRARSCGPVVRPSRRGARARRACGPSGGDPLVHRHRRRLRRAEDVGHDGHRGSARVAPSG